jgi:hypothetical protein
MDDDEKKYLTKNFNELHTPPDQQAVVVALEYALSASCAVVRAGRPSMAAGGARLPRPVRVDDPLSGPPWGLPSPTIIIVVARYDIVSGNLHHP